MKKLILLCAALCGAILQAAPPILTVADSTRQLASTETGVQKIKVKAEGDLSGLTLRAKIVAYGKTEPRIWSRQLKAEPETELAVELKEFGFYELTVFAFRGKEEVSKVVTHYALVPPPRRERPEDFGCCVHFGQDNPRKGAIPISFELMKMAGFTRMRDDLYWSGFEKKPGVYQVHDRLERAIAAAHRYGIRPLLVIGYNNTVAYPGKFGRTFLPNEEMYRIYGNAVAAGMRHFGDRVTEWELWNEPKPEVHPVKDYLAMLKVVYPMARAANPAATIISCGGGGAGGGPGGEMIIPILRAGGVDLQDAFSIHPYMAPHQPEVGYETRGSAIPRVNIPVVANHMRNIVRSNPRTDGVKLKPYITEIGWFVEHPTRRLHAITPVTQAAFAARCFLAMRREATYAGVYWYDFQDDGDNPSEKEDNFGLIRADYSPKPAFQAVAVLNGLLGNLPFTKALKDGEQRISLYGSGEDSLIAAWSLSDKPDKATVELPYPAAQASVVSWEGRPAPFKITGERSIELTLSGCPQYITVKP